LRKVYGEINALKSKRLTYERLLKNILEIESKVKNLEAKLTESHKNNPMLNALLSKLKHVQDDFDLTKNKALSNLEKNTFNDDLEQLLEKLNQIENGLEKKQTDSRILEGIPHSQNKNDCCSIF
jgi:hypothetical protein